MLRSISAEILEGELAFTISERTTAAEAKQGIVVSRRRFDADDQCEASDPFRLRALQFRLSIVQVLRS